MRDEFTEIQWRCDMPSFDEVARKFFDCPFCNWHYSPGLIPSAQGEYNENRALQHHIEYRHSWRELIVAGQKLQSELAVEKMLSRSCAMEVLELRAKLAQVKP
jgi:hypothetical protein